MATAKNTKGRKAKVVSNPEWVVPIEATVTGYTVIEAESADAAYEVADSLIDQHKFGTLHGESSIDLDAFIKLVIRGEVTGAVALEDIFPNKKRREPAKNKAKATPKPKAAPKSTAKKAPAKGRTRGAAPKKATNPKTGTKTAAKKAAPKKTPAKAGRRRGTATS